MNTLTEYRVLDMSVKPREWISYMYTENGQFKSWLAVEEIARLIICVNWTRLLTIAIALYIAPATLITRS